MKYKVIATTFAIILLAVCAAFLKPVDISYAAAEAVASATPKTSQTVKAKTVRELTYTDGEFDGKKIVPTDYDWKKILTPAEFAIIRQDGTAAPYRRALP